MTPAFSFGYGALPEGVPDVLAVGHWRCLCPEGQRLLIDNHQVDVMWGHCWRCGATCEVTRAEMREVEG